MKEKYKCFVKLCTVVSKVAIKYNIQFIRIHLRIEVDSIENYTFQEVVAYT